MLKAPRFSVVDAFEKIMKNEQKRWGLTCVSYLTWEVQNQVQDLQKKILNCYDPRISQEDLYQNSFIRFYSKEHLHTTHFTLTRSREGKPYGIADLIKKDKPHSIAQFYRSFCDIIPEIHPFSIRLTELKFADDGIGFVLLGKVESEQNEQDEQGEQDIHKEITPREKLITEINSKIRPFFNLSPRKYDEKDHNTVHCYLGYIILPPRKDFKEFIEEIESMKIDLSYRVEELWLIHHRYRTLREPHEGMIKFKLNQPVDCTETEFFEHLGLY